MTFALSKVSMPRIKTLEIYSSACLENRNCDFNCIRLKRANNVKCLGIYFDKYTKWITQINLNRKRIVIIQKAFLYNIN